MRTARRKGNLVFVFIAVHMVLVFSCSFNTEEIQKAVQDSIDTRNSPKTTDVSGDGMSSNGTTDAAWTDPAEKAGQGGTPSPSWSPNDCSGLDFVRYELKNTVEEDYGDIHECKYEWHITNVDDTIHVRPFLFITAMYPGSEVIDTNEWIGLGVLKPGQARISVGFLTDQLSEIYYSSISKLAVIVDLDQCEWVWEGELFDDVAVELPSPCTQ
jgi:hypothetical protein